MKSYGKLVEYKASMFHGTCPFDLTIAQNVAIPIRFGQSVDDLDVLDTDIYSYDPTNPNNIVCKLSGWYDVRATVNFEQSSGGKEGNVIGWFSSNNGFGTTYNMIQKTLSFGYMRNDKTRYGTISISQPIKLVNPSTTLRLEVERNTANSSIFLRAGEASVFIQRLRPLQDTGK